MRIRVASDADAVDRRPIVVADRVGVHRCALDMASENAKALIGRCEVSLFAFVVRSITVAIAEHPVRVHRSSA